MTGIAGISLRVRDLGRVAAFYRDVIGLALDAASGPRVRLGGLLTLVETPDAPPDDPGRPGLFHTALLLPSREHLGGWLAAGLAPLDGHADHLVSEALYLRDPEGNGIELYADRPRETWTFDGPLLRMANARLDLPALAAAGAPWHGAPAGTRIGHVHLRTHDLAAEEAFLTGTLGMTVMARSLQAVFCAWDGYHHHVAANTWSAARPFAPGLSGLASVAAGLDAFSPSGAVFTA